MYRKLLNVVLFLMACMAFGAVAASDPPAAIESGIVKARVTAVASNYTSFTVRIGDGEEKLVLDEVAAKALQAKLRINPGDRIAVILGAPEAAGGTTVKEFKGLEKQVGVGYRLLFLFIGLVVILACFAVFSTGNLRGFVIGADNRYSNSKIQIVLWFGSLFVIYLGTLMLRVYVYGWDLLGGVGITENLLALSGLSAFTYGSAKAITSSQHE
ncbi:MAG TPA: hypothetical protein PLL14_10645, partial [Accumulibacter sp.]|nr:hypothetical protein [Accumulibacter sp.]